MISGAGAGPDRRAFQALCLEEEKHAVLALAHQCLAWRHRCEHLQQKQKEKAKAEADAKSGEETAEDLKEAISQAHAANFQSKMELDDSLAHHASQELLGDRSTMLVAMTAYGGQMKRCSPELQGDPEIAVAAMASCPAAWEHVGRNIRKDRRSMSAAIRQNGIVLQFARRRLRDDRDLVLAAIASSDGWALDFASHRLRADREVVLAALNKEDPSDGARASVLEFASPELLNDKELVLQAAASKAWILEAVSQDLKGDREVVLTALRSQTEHDISERDENMFAYASEELRDDEEIVLEAMRLDGAALELAAPSLRANKDFVLMAARRILEGQREACYSKADASVHEAVSLEHFQGACSSRLALAGEQCPVLTITLGYGAPSQPASSCSSPRPVTNCEVSLLSGTSFTCSLATNSGHAAEPSGGPDLLEPVPKRARLSDLGEEQQEQPAAAPAQPEVADAQAQTQPETTDVAPQPISTVAELAELLLTELPQHMQQARPPPRRIFIVFARDGDVGNTVSVTPWDWNRALSEFA